MATKSGIVWSSARVYRMLLLLHPQSFRREYGPSMTQAFDDCCRAAANDGGRVKVLRVWLWAAHDLACSAVRERASEVLGSPTQALARWGAMAGMLGGLLFTAKSFWDINDGPTVGTDITDDLAFIPPMLFLVGLFALFVGMKGRISRLGWPGFALGFLGAIAGSIGEIWGEWPVPALGLVALLGGLVLIGVVTISTEVLGSRSSLPLATGVLGLAWAFTDSYGVVEIWARLIHLTFALAFGACWILIGITVRSGLQGTSPGPRADVSSMEQIG